MTVTVMTFASGAFALVAGYLTDDGPVLVLGFFCALLGFSLLFHHAYEINSNASIELKRTERERTRGSL